MGEGRAEHPCGEGRAARGREKKGAGSVGTEEGAHPRGGLARQGGRGLREESPGF